MLYEVHLLAILVTCCCLGLQKKKELSYPLRVDAGLQYLKRAGNIFVKWKASGTTGLTFIACIQTINALSELVKHLQKKHGFSYILSGKFMSDLIEGRFGWYRQVNESNFYISVKQVLQAEKKNAEFASTASISICSWIICTRFFTS